MSVYMYTHIDFTYTYIYICIHIHICVYVFIYVCFKYKACRASICGTVVVVLERYLLHLILGPAYDTPAQHTPAASKTLLGLGGVVLDSMIRRAGASHLPWEPLRGLRSGIYVDGRYDFTNLKA